VLQDIRFAFRILVKRVLFQLAPTDPLITIVLIAVALSACLIPAWKAARIEPLTPIRVD
jgi:ABC-type lipoprotein release transport system permease subunit